MRTLPVYSTSEVGGLLGLTRGLGISVARPGRVLSRIDNRDR